MNAQEFEQFTERLFIAFPSLGEWINEKSPEPQETLRVWRRCLDGYSVAECDSVLERWSTGVLEAFKAYERDQVHLMIRQVIERDRSLKRKATRDADSKDYWSQEMQRRMSRRTGTHEGGHVAGESVLAACGSEMVAAFEKLKPAHKRMLDGELPEAEYVRFKNKVLEELDRMGV